MSKKRVKRYTLVSYVKPELREYNCDEELETFKKKLDVYNSNDKNPYMCGNIEIEIQNGKIFVRFNRYKKLMPKNFLEDIDKETLEYRSIDEVKKKFNIPTKSDIFIAYRSKGDLELLPVFTEKYKEYFDPKYLRNALISRCIGIDFIYDIYNDKYVGECRKKGVYKSLSDLLIAKEKIKCGMPIDVLLSTVYDLYYHLMRKEDGTQDYKMRRYIIEKLRNLDILDEKKKKQEEMTEEENYQFTLNDYIHKTTK